MGKKYAAAEAQVTEELYAPLEAMALVKDIAFANFDETVDVDIRLNLDTRQADQQLRGTVSLPNGSGKTVRVAVFAEGDAARAAEEAGADIVGSDDLVVSSVRAALCRTPSSARSRPMLQRQSRSSKAAVLSIVPTVMASAMLFSAR